MDLFASKELYDSGVNAEALDALTGLALQKRAAPNRAERRKFMKTQRAQVRRYHRIVSGEMEAKVQKRRIRKKRGNAARRLNRGTN